MSNPSTNKDGGHSHPQKSNSNNNDRGNSARDKDPDSGKVLGSGEKVKSHQGPNESFGSKGSRDNH